MTPSPQQLAIGNFVRANPSTSVSIIAVAGSGKSTTIVWLGREIIPRAQASVFLAFNASAAESLSEKLPYWISASTFHKYCLNAMRLANLKPKIDDKKCKWKLKALVPDWKTRIEQESGILRAVGFAKSYGTGVLADAPSIEDLAEAEDVDPALCAEVLSESRKDRARVDFDDMLYACLDWNIPLPKVHNLFIDEAQDTNAVQLALATKMLHPNGRAIIVGDPMQAIYGFRGADHRAMSNLATAFNTTEFPLSVSYRCSKAVVKEAQSYILNPKQ